MLNSSQRIALVVLVFCLLMSNSVKAGRFVNMTYQTCLVEHTVNENRISILSYNLFLIPFSPHSASNPSRAAAIPKWVRSSANYDIAVFSENWEYPSTVKDGMITLQSPHPRYCSYVYDSKGPLGSGLAIYSKYAIEGFKFVSFKNCKGNDCLADKGVLYAWIKAGKRKIHVFASHTNAGAGNDRTRLSQFSQIRRLIDEQRYEAGDLLLIAGDLNENKYSEQKYRSMLDTLGASEITSSGGSEKYSYDGPNNDLTNGSDQEVLDYVLYEITTRTAKPWPESRCKTVRARDDYLLFNNRDLSDHYPVGCEIILGPQSSSRTNYQAIQEEAAGKKVVLECSQKSRKSLIAVASGSYGLRCGTPKGNATQHLAKHCNGKQSCEYEINYEAIGDPTPYCAKDYLAEWSCIGDNALLPSKMIPAEASGKSVKLECGKVWASPGPPRKGLVSVRAGTYGLGCGAPQGNDTTHLADACDGKESCKYRVDHLVIGDPAPNCAKEYIAEWKCVAGPRADLDGNIIKALTKPLANGEYRIRQVSSRRYLDAYQRPEDGYAVVTRKSQKNDSQVWTLKNISSPKGKHIYQMRQLSSGRNLVVDGSNNSDTGVITSELQADDPSQQWQIKSTEPGKWTIREKSSSRESGYLDAYQSDKRDFRVVTRDKQDNDTQLWWFVPFNAVDDKKKKKKKPGGDKEIRNIGR